MKKAIFIICVIIGLNSCNSGGDSSQPSKSEVELAQHILELNKRFDDIFVNDYDRQKLTQISDSIVISLEEMTTSYPESSELPSLYFVAGEVSMKVFNGERAVKYFEKMVELYPEDAQTDKAMYFIGYTYENVIQDVEKAKEKYKALYREKPNSDWGENAKSQVLFLESSSPMIDKVEDVDDEEVVEEQ